MSGPVSQSILIQCAVNKALNEGKIEETKEALNFMMRYKPEEQWALCRTRILQTVNKIQEIINERNLELQILRNKPNQIGFLKWKPQFGTDRIAIAIGPDTYCSHFMEVCLLRPNTRDFLDKWGYQNQDTNVFDNWEDLLTEILRIYDIYKSF